MSTPVPSASGTMMFLRAESTALLEELTKRLHPDFATDDLAPTDIRISDFDDTHFRVEVLESSLDTVRVSMAMPAFKQLEGFGVTAHLRGIYGEYCITPVAGADFSVEVKRPLPSGRADEVLRNIALMRRHALSVPFRTAMKTVTGGTVSSTTTTTVTISTGAAAAVAAGSSTLSPPMGPSASAASSLAPGAGAITTLRLRPNEPIFIQSRSDRVSVIYALEFEDATDRAIARTICQEFVECQRHVSNAPPVTFYDRESAAPLELRGAGLAAAGKQTEAFVGYLAFALLPQHFEGAKAEGTITQMTQFRGYMDYHIKAAKAYMHARMRTRVDGWLQSLRRAIIDEEKDSKEKKRIDGRTFVRK